MPNMDPGAGVAADDGVDVLKVPNVLVGCCGLRPVVEDGRNEKAEEAVAGFGAPIAALGAKPPRPVPADPNPPNADGGACCGCPNTDGGCCCGCAWGWPNMVLDAPVPNGPVVWGCWGCPKAAPAGRPNMPDDVLPPKTDGAAGGAAAADEPNSEVLGWLPKGLGAVDPTGCCCCWPKAVEGAEVPKPPNPDWPNPGIADGAAPAPKAPGVGAALAEAPNGVGAADEAEPKMLLVAPAEEGPPKGPLEPNAPKGFAAVVEPKAPCCWPKPPIDGAVVAVPKAEGAPNAEVAVDAAGPVVAPNRPEVPNGDEEEGVAAGIPEDPPNMPPVPNVPKPDDGAAEEVIEDVPIPLPLLNVVENAPGAFPGYEAGPFLPRA